MNDKHPARLLLLLNLVVQQPPDPKAKEARSWDKIARQAAQSGGRWHLQPRDFQRYRNMTLREFIALAADWDEDDLPDRKNPFQPKGPVS